MQGKTAYEEETGFVRRRVLLQMSLQLVQTSQNKRRLHWRHWTECPIDRHIVDTLMHWWLSEQMCLIQTYASNHCWYCGLCPSSWQPLLLYDHVFPKQYETTPLVRCCLYCNSSKQAKTPLEWRGRSWPFWFIRVGLGQSPLGYALLENTPSFQRLYARYLNGQSCTT